MSLSSAYEVLACHCRYHPFTAKGMQAVISSIPELHIVGKAFNGIDAISLIKREQPDCALLDLSMPGANGLEVFQEAKRWAPNTRFAIITSISTSRKRNPFSAASGSNIS